MKRGRQIILSEVARAVAAALLGVAIAFAITVTLGLIFIGPPS